MKRLSASETDLVLSIRRARGCDFRTFELHRDIDDSGISGTGVVAWGVQFPDGFVALRWATETASTVVYEGGIDSVLEIHGHGGNTRVVWTIR